MPSVNKHDPFQVWHFKDDPSDLYQIVSADMFSSKFYLLLHLDSMTIVWMTDDYKSLVKDMELQRVK